MIRTALITAASFALLAGSAAGAAPCRDTKGHFIKCPAPTATNTTTTSTTKTTRCRDSKGHFVKCGTPGAKPA